jgi:hypothetical protein
MVREVEVKIESIAPLVVEAAASEEEASLQKDYGDASSQGIRGVLLPNAAPGGQGGSAGFDPEKLMPIVVDPDIAGSTYTIEPGAVKSADKGTSKGLPATDFDQENVRKIADKNMRAALQPAEAMPEKEEPVAKKKTTRRRTSKPKQEETPTPTPQPEPIVETPVPAPPPAPELPDKVIAFDFGPPMGTMETRYHDIFREGNKLVLAWDSDCTNACKYTPAAMETAVRVVVGREREEYSVFSLGLVFSDDTTGRQYIVLLIDQRD